jgi:hypothetical protein
VRVVHVFLIQIQLETDEKSSLGKRDQRKERLEYCFSRQGHLRFFGQTESRRKQKKFGLEEKTKE